MMTDLRRISEYPRDVDTSLTPGTRLLVQYSATTYINICPPVAAAHWTAAVISLVKQWRVLEILHISRTVGNWCQHEMNLATFNPFHAKLPEWSYYRRWKALKLTLMALLKL